MLARTIFKQIMKLVIFLYRRSGGKIGGSMRGMPVLLLTTTGRKTSLKRTTPVMYLTDGPNYVITASNGGRDSHPAWWLNLQANPQATIELDGMAKPVIAQQASLEEKSRLWPQLVGKAPFFDDYQRSTKRVIPLVILRPM